MLLHKFNEVRYRLLVLILLAALPGLLLLFEIAKQQWKFSEEAAQEQGVRVAQEAIQLTRKRFRDTEEILKELSKNPAIQQQNSTICREELSKLLHQFSQYANFGVARSDGTVFCSAIPLSDVANVSDRPWFQQVFQTCSLAIGKFQISPITETPILALGYPISRNKCQNTPVVFASLKLELLEPAIIQKLPPEATISLLDRQRIVLAHHPNSARWVSKSVKYSSLFKQLTQSQSEITVRPNIEGLDGTPHVFVFSRLNQDRAQENDMYVAIGIPNALIQQKVGWVMGRYVLLVITPVLCTLGLAWYVAIVGIQRPIRLLGKAARQLANGDLTARVELPSGSGEFDQLATAYNAIVTDLESHIKEQVAVQKDKEFAEFKAQFVAMVSHELRTPLTVMQVSTELLEHFSELASTEQKQQYLGRMQNAVTQMSHLIEQILLLGRPESGEIGFNPVDLNLTNFCQDIVDELQLGVAKDRTIVFSSQGNRVEVRLDVDLLRSMLTNLLTNAIKYSPKNMAITFNLECQDNQLIFQVKDEGIGIPQADQSQLFEAFQRASNVGGVPGTGLGLAIVKRCVELHRGDISFESVEGRGTTFWVTLPRE
jgi:signal transduction histidine kinase